MGEHKDEQDKPLQGPGQNQPMTQPDTSNAGDNDNKDREAKDREASDQDYMKKHSPSPNNPNNPDR